MKNTTIPTNLISAGLALGALFAFAAPTATMAADENKDRSGFLEKIDTWQDKMSDRFHDTWQKLRGEDKADSMSGKSLSTASVDLREQKDSYTIRLNLPGRNLDDVEIRLDDNLLRIVAPAHAKVGRYEQTVALANVKPGAEPKIERKAKDHMIVVTIPKGDGKVVEEGESTALPDPALLPLTEWDLDIISRMERMRREMDRAFRDAFNEVRTEPAFEGFFDEPRFGSAVDLQEEDDKYIVRAYLPDREMKNVSVTVEGQTLKLEAREEEAKQRKEDDAVLHSKRMAAYTQMLALPGPVQSDNMEVKQMKGMVIVTLPKAK